MIEACNTCAKLLFERPSGGLRTNCLLRALNCQSKVARSSRHKGAVRCANRTLDIENEHCENFSRSVDHVELALLLF